MECSIRFSLYFDVFVAIVAKFLRKIFFGIRQKCYIQVCDV